MARSLKKGPFIDLHLMKKVQTAVEKNENMVVHKFGEFAHTRNFRSHSSNKIK